MTLFKILLTIHILTGGASLFVGTIIMFVKKGDQRHRYLGIVYFVAMIITGFSAIAMSYLHSNYFLLITGVFTTYMILTGKRYLKIKKIADVKLQDWFLAIIMFIFGTAFISYGSYILLSSNTFGIVLLVFGIISWSFAYQDFTNFKGNSNIKNFWITTHIQRMTGSYIAATTAFLVVNNTVLPDIVAWLLPTLVLIPFIIAWRKKYQVMAVKAPNIK